MLIPWFEFRGRDGGVQTELSDAEVRQITTKVDSQRAKIQLRRQTKLEKAVSSASPIREATRLFPWRLYQRKPFAGDGVRGIPQQSLRHQTRRLADRHFFGTEGLSARHVSAAWPAQSVARPPEKLQAAQSAIDSPSCFAQR